MNKLKSIAIILARVIALQLIGFTVIKLAFMVLPGNLLHAALAGGAGYLIGKYILTLVNIPNNTYFKIKNFLLGQ